MVLMRGEGYRDPVGLGVGGQKSDKESGRHGDMSRFFVTPVEAGLEKLAVLQGGLKSAKDIKDDSVVRDIELGIRLAEGDITVARDRGFLKLDESIFASKDSVGVESLEAEARVIDAQISDLRQQRKDRLRRGGHTEIDNLLGLNNQISALEERLGVIRNRINLADPELDLSFLEDFGDPELRELDRHIETIGDEIIQTRSELGTVSDEIAGINDRDSIRYRELLIRQSELHRLMVELEQELHDVSTSDVQSGAEYSDAVEVDNDRELHQLETEMREYDEAIERALSNDDRREVEDLLRDWRDISIELDAIHSEMGGPHHDDEFGETGGIHEDMSIDGAGSFLGDAGRDRLARSRKLKDAQLRMIEIDAVLRNVELSGDKWSIIPTLLNWRSTKIELMRAEDDMRAMVEGETPLSGELNESIFTSTESDLWGLMSSAPEVPEGSDIMETDDPRDMDDEMDSGELLQTGMHVDSESTGMQGLAENDLEKLFFDMPADE
jgi:hypothetical protein